MEWRSNGVLVERPQAHHRNTHVLHHSAGTFPSFSLVENSLWALPCFPRDSPIMKSAYELAMERLQKDAPSVPLSAEQRAQIAEIDSLYTAKIAEKDLLLKSEIAQELAKGKFDQIEQLQKQLSSELRRLNEEREEKKEKVRQPKA
jgi:hypothetical protein